MCRFLCYLGPPVTLASVVLDPPHSPATPGVGAETPAGGSDQRRRVRGGLVRPRPPARAGPLPHRPAHLGRPVVRQPGRAGDGAGAGGRGARRHARRPRSRRPAASRSPPGRGCSPTTARSTGWGVDPAVKAGPAPAAVGRAGRGGIEGGGRLGGALRPRPRPPRRGARRRREALAAVVAAAVARWHRRSAQPPPHRRPPGGRHRLRRLAVRPARATTRWWWPPSRTTTTPAGEPVPDGSMVEAGPGWVSTVDAVTRP